jgi:hypothetical protein
MDLRGLPPERSPLGFEVVLKGLDGVFTSLLTLPMMDANLMERMSSGRRADELGWLVER